MRTHARLLLATLVTLAVSAGLAVVASLPTNAAAWAPRASTSFDPASDLDEFESRILRRVNRVRDRRDLPRVRVFHSCIDGYAERWAAHLQDRGTLVHRDLDAVLGGCNLSWVGENLVSGTALRPGVAVRAWMDSPPHRAVLMKPRARWAGIGVRVGAGGRTYAVLNFGDRG